MPALGKQTIEDLTSRLRKYVDLSGGADEIAFLDAGGSAAVFRIKKGTVVRAIKVFDPELFQDKGTGGLAERRRLLVQERLINHKCKSLIQTYRVIETEGTAFIEMEFNDWPQLAKSLSQIPDDAVIPLIGQLVDAVKYLESLNIVHRDIKPENIHVSPDFRQLKLLDLGVAREFDSPEENEAAVTDDGQRRPFLATAQYSSPEYLFRLDEPTAKLWQGLNLYQVGAVLHDLIKKEAIFQHEVSLGNRWLVARAVLTKLPTFSDSDLGRLTSAKALSLRCLSKNIDTRLALAGWEDFRLEETSDPISALRGRLSRQSINQNLQANQISNERLQFDRAEYLRRLFENVRAELINDCGTKLPFAIEHIPSGDIFNYVFKFEPGDPYVIECTVKVEWKNGIYERLANISFCARALKNNSPISDIEKSPALEITLDESESENILIVLTEIARLVGSSLDKIEISRNED